MHRLFDMHCHLDRIANAEEVAAQAAARGFALLCTPVTPRESAAAAERFAGAGNVRVGVGFHPWWVEVDERGEVPGLERLDEAIARARFVGEVGLDFGRAHEVAREAQLAVFERIARACAERPVEGRVLSIHAVHAADTVMDVLEEHGLTGAKGRPGMAACIFHWFSGTSAELARARYLGCYFSVNEMMLATKKGREYARIVPEDRLLLETDAPPGLDAPYSAAELERSLMGVLGKLAEIRRCDRDGLAARIAATSAALFAPI